MTRFASTPVAAYEPEMAGLRKGAVRRQRARQFRERYSAGGKRIRTFGPAALRADPISAVCDHDFVEIITYKSELKAARAQRCGAACRAWPANSRKAALPSTPVSCRRPARCWCANGAVTPTPRWFAKMGSNMRCQLYRSLTVIAERITGAH